MSGERKVSSDTRREAWREARPEVRRVSAEEEQVAAMVQRHAERARSETGRGSAHALDVRDFERHGVRLWGAWDGELLLAVGGLMKLDDTHGELKCFFTSEAARGRGVGGQILCRIVDAARGDRLSRLSLETGAWPYFAPARAFYAGHGFEVCGPFGSYREDPNSVFMTRVL